MQELKFFECELCGELFYTAEECAEHEQSCGDMGDVLFLRANGNPVTLFGPNREVMVKGEIEDLEPMRRSLVAALRQVDIMKTRGIRADGKQMTPPQLLMEIFPKEARHA